MKNALLRFLPKVIHRKMVIRLHIVNARFVDHDLVLSCLWTLLGALLTILYSIKL